MATDLLGYFQKAKSAVRAAKAASDTANISAAVASGSSDATPNQTAVDNLFAD